MKGIIYCEWLIPVTDYYRILRKNEAIYEIVIPLAIAIISSSIYRSIDSVIPALLKLRDILPSALAILIGFSITCITILITSNNKNIDMIKAKKTERILAGTELSIYQWMLIMFIYSLIIQIALLLMVFFVAFVLRICIANTFVTFLLGGEVYLVLHILLLLVRSITNFYFIFLATLKPNDTAQ